MQKSEYIICFHPELCSFFQRAYRQKFDLGEPDIPLKLASPPKDKKRRKRSLAHGDQEGESGPAKKKRKKKKEDESKNEGEGVKKKKEKVRFCCQKFSSNCGKVKVEVITTFTNTAGTNRILL